MVLINNIQLGNILIAIMFLAIFSDLIRCCFQHFLVDIFHYSFIIRNAFFVLFIETLNGSTPEKLR